MAQSKRSVITAVAVCGYLSSILSLASWLCFQLFTRNPFDWQHFSAGQFWGCAGMSATALLLFYLARWLQRRSGKPVRGGLLACVVFLVSTAFWLYTAADYWVAWGAAKEAGSFFAIQLHRLRGAVAWGALASLLPLLTEVISAVRRRRS